MRLPTVPIPSSSAFVFALALSGYPLGILARATPALLPPRQPWKRQDFGNGSTTPEPPGIPTALFTLFTLAPADADINTRPVVIRGGFFFIDLFDPNGVPRPPPPPPVDDCEDDGYGTIDDNLDCGNSTGAVEAEEPVVLMTDGEGGVCVIVETETVVLIMLHDGENTTNLKVFLSTTTGILSHLPLPLPFPTQSLPIPVDAAFTPFQRLGLGNIPPITETGLLRSIFDWGSVRPDLTTPGWFGCPAPTASDEGGDPRGGLRLVKRLTPGLDIGEGCRGPWELGVVDF